MIKITIENDIYPQKLKEITNPPKQLYLEGNVKLLNENSIAIIGSRNCSENGKQLTRKFAYELSKQGLIIISGMAKGIDTIAHEETINAKCKTIAVLGSGFHNIFPKENSALYKKILEKDGLIISEYAPEIQAQSKQFLERNRIISGLSIGVLVIEAGYRSGTSVTAKIAKKQNRKVFVLPHEINDKYGIGTNKLIQKGAILVTSTKDIVENFKFLKYKEILNHNKIEKNDISANNKLKNKLENNSNIKSNIKTDIKSNIQSSVTTNIKFNNKEEKEIYNLVKNNINNINEIFKVSKIPINKINETLLILELENHIEKSKGGYICT